MDSGVFGLDTLNRKMDSLILSVPYDHRPIIGIGGMFHGRYTAVQSLYVQAVEDAGGIPLVLPVIQETATLLRYSNMIDGLLLPGGEDVDPRFYGQQASPKMGEVDLRRDYYELQLIRIARRKGLPVLAICRGMQVVNVALGGTLSQDIPSDSLYIPRVEHHQKSEKAVLEHSIKIRPDSRLCQLLGQDLLTVNSFHHQCVRQPAPEMRITAEAIDGVPEAMEGENILCVQFHPEALYQTHPEFRSLFTDLIQRSQKYAEKSLKEGLGRAGEQ